MKLVSAAGVAPAVTRAQTEHVAATPRAVAPANGWRRGLGSCGDGRTASLDTSTHGRLADSNPDSSRLNFPADNGVLRLIELRVQKGRNAEFGRRNIQVWNAPGLLFRIPRSALRVSKWWEALVTLQFVASDFVLRHPIYSRAAGSLPRNWSREWESHPPEEVYEASLCALVEFPAVEIGGVGG